MTSSTPEETLAILQFAPMPFAIISFFSSSYSIYFLVHKERARLKRMYHRLVLAMHLALLPLSVTWVWGPFAVPEGTPYYPVASGTVQTCTAQAFVYFLFQLTVPTYYASLSLQAFLGIRNNFKEEKYRWIEKWVHIVAYCIPFALAIVFAATENFNPGASICYIHKAPQGCETDPNVACQRGKDIETFEYIVGFLLIFIYFIFPPSVIAWMYCWVKRVGKNMETSTGLHRVRESARKKIMRSVAQQLSVYLLSFWATWICELISSAYTILTREMLHDFLIFGNCMLSFQGFIFTMVYFGLERLGIRIEDDVGHVPTSKSQRDTTVRDIRENAEKRNQNEPSTTCKEREHLVFNIFDGIPDKDSPWAKFIDPDYDDDNQNADALDEGSHISNNEVFVENDWQ